MLLAINANSAPLLTKIWEFLSDYIIFPLQNISIVNVIDIVVLSFLIYMIYKFIRDRHAGRAVIGLGLLLLLYAISEIFGMVAINSILSNFYTVGIVALVVLFQPELRDVLELKTYYGLSTKEISQTLHVNEALVRKRLQRARQILKGRI